MELTRAEQLRVAAFLAPYLRVPLDLTLETIEEAPDGGLHLDLHFSHCCYVVIDHDDAVVYVGKCDRQSGTLKDRFRRHHARADFWDRVWALPLRAELSSDDVFAVETSLVHHFSPIGNMTLAQNTAARTPS